ncbi:2-hydroxyacid dehydrogenase [Entomobacter blattae]|uniref:2-ketogluconate reductase n=1 Tax=Entomobacter blattae TaxID=2762277 RepID=A0A7H1NUA2_9PROT|nr:2-hydroxyacid dehydrogenase [Entomobacter blattae]QNT79362.1 2-ketogluconate reductase [Entomobacter blattae]
MKPVILQIERMMPEIEKRLNEAFEVHHYTGDLPDTALAERIKGVATGGGSGLAPKIFDALPNLEIIAINGVGTDAVDLEKAKARGVRVTTTPGVLTNDVADMAIGLMISLLRNLALGDRFIRAEKWGKETMPLGRTVSGKPFGIMGLGHIGRNIAKRLVPFEGSIYYFDPRSHDDVPYVYVPNLVDLAKKVKVLFIAASGGPKSLHTINQEVLEALGPEGVIINVARGSVVDEKALVKALQEKTIAGAALDVFEHEPNVPAELKSMDNVVISPHQASATRETRLAMGDLVFRNLEDHFAGKPLLTAVV